MENEDMVKCKHCKKMIDEDAKVCPYCQKKQGMGCGVWIVGFLIVGCILFYMSGTPISSISNRTQEKQSSTERIATDDPNVWQVGQFLYAVTKAESDSAGYMHIYGEVKNCGASCSYVQIEFACYNDNDAKVGTAMDNISGLAKDEIWQFEAVGLSGGTKYTYQSLTGH